MATSQCIRRGLAAAAVLSVLASGRANAAPTRHALLIGIGTYSIRALEGPPNDVQSLATALTKFGFDAGNVRVLLNADASRAGILAAIDALNTTTQPGDFILIYYSGHGTSAMDRRLRIAGISSSSGGLIPADFRAGTNQEMLDRLIVGSRDLQPRIMRLEATRDVALIFDTCYSANTARSLGVPRSIPWPPATRAGGLDFGDDSTVKRFGEESQEVAPYPYKKALYIAAAGLAEEAEDIPQRLVHIKTTIDNRAHGALTNSLLLGLRGDADTNHDGQITYRELFEFSKGYVTRNFPHTPQLSAPLGRDDLLERPVFQWRGRAGDQGSDQTPVPPSLRLRVLIDRATLGTTMDAAIAAITGVTLVPDGAHDVRLRREPTGALVVLHGSGDLIARFMNSPSSQTEVVDRVRRQVRIHQLLNQTFAAQSFNVRVNVPAPNGFLTVGDRVVVEYASEISAYLLILNMDAEGFVTVLRPNDPDELSPVQSGKMPPVTVEPLGLGTEFVKAIAFEQKPANLDRWQHRTFDPDSADMDALVSMIRSTPGRKSQSVLKVVTATAGKP